jgi:hypothetical protein
MRRNFSVNHRYSFKTSESPKPYSKPQNRSQIVIFCQIEGKEEKEGVSSVTVSRETGSGGRFRIPHGFELG